MPRGAADPVVVDQKKVIPSRVVGVSTAAALATRRNVGRSNPERHYEELRDLGSGAFGAAVLVRRRRDGRRFVAKKCCVKDLSEKQRAMCMEEILLLRRVRHSCIAEVVDFLWASADHMNYWVVLKYYAGGDVQGEIDRCRDDGLVFAPGKVRNWISQLCMALEHVHALHIVHRDVKGSNLFVTGADNIVLGDFGVSKQLDAAGCKAMTQVGSPVFMAPESWDGRGGTVASDMWSVGIVLYELLALRRPFEAQNVLSLVHKITTEEPPDLPEDCEENVVELTFNLLQKCPEKRPTANEALEYPSLKSCVGLLEIYRAAFENISDKQLTKAAVLEDRACERGIPAVSEIDEGSEAEEEDYAMPSTTNLVDLIQHMHSSKIQTNSPIDENCCEDGDESEDEDEDEEEEASEDDDREEDEDHKEDEDLESDEVDEEDERHSTSDTFQESRNGQICQTIDLPSESHDEATFVTRVTERLDIKKNLETHAHEVEQDAECASAGSWNGGVAFELDGDVGEQFAEDTLQQPPEICNESHAGNCVGQSVGRCAADDCTLLPSENDNLLIQKLQRSIAEETLAPSISFHSRSAMKEGHGEAERPSPKTETAASNMSCNNRAEAVGELTLIPQEASAPLFSRTEHVSGTALGEPVDAAANVACPSIGACVEGVQRRDCEMTLLCAGLKKADDDSAAPSRTRESKTATDCRSREFTFEMAGASQDAKTIGQCHDNGCTFNISGSASALSYSDSVALADTAAQSKDCSPNFGETSPAFGLTSAVPQTFGSSSLANDSQQLSINHAADLARQRQNAQFEADLVDSHVAGVGQSQTRSTIDALAKLPTRNNTEITCAPEQLGELSVANLTMAPDTSTTTIQAQTLHSRQDKECTFCISESMSSLTYSASIDPTNSAAYAKDTSAYLVEPLSLSKASESSKKRGDVNRTFSFSSSVDVSQVVGVGFIKTVSEQHPSRNDASSALHDQFEYLPPCSCTMSSVGTLKPDALDKGQATDHNHTVKADSSPATTPRINPDWTSDSWAGVAPLSTRLVDEESLLRAALCDRAGPGQAPPLTIPTVIVKDVSATTCNHDCEPEPACEESEEDTRDEDDEEDEEDDIGEDLEEEEIGEDSHDVEDLGEDQLDDETIDEIDEEVADATQTSRDTIVDLTTQYVNQQTWRIADSTDSKEPFEPPVRASPRTIAERESTTFSSLPPGARIAALPSPPRVAGASFYAPMVTVLESADSPEKSTFSVPPRGAPSNWTRGTFSSSNCADGCVVEKATPGAFAFGTLRPSVADWRRRTGTVGKRERFKMGALSALAAASGSTIAGFGNATAHSTVSSKGRRSPQP